MEGNSTQKDHYKNNDDKENYDMLCQYFVEILFNDMHGISI